MIHQSLILILVCFYFSEADSDTSVLANKITNSNTTHSDLCLNSDVVSKWEEATRAKLENDVFVAPFVNKTRRGGKWKRKNLVMVKLNNKRRRKKLVTIKAEAEYKIDIMNKLQTKAEVLLVIDFQNKSACGVGAIIKGDLNSTKKMLNDSMNCLTIEASIDPRRRVMYPLLTPKCGCFIFRYHYGYREDNTTVIRTADPTSPKPHKRQTKIHCIGGDETKEGKAKKHHRRRKNRRMNRKEKILTRNMREILSRSKKDTFQIWENRDRYTTSNPPYHRIDNEDLRENGYEYEAAENEIDTDGIGNNVILVAETTKKSVDYEEEAEDQISEEEERNLNEDLEYEEESDDDKERNFSDYEKVDVSQENDSEHDEKENEVKYIDDDKDDESIENDEEYHQYDSISLNEADDLNNNENYDKKYEIPEDGSNSSESDESGESSEDSEEKPEVINNSEDSIERDDKKIENNNSINSIDVVYNRNDVRRRPHIRRKPFAISFNNGERHRHPSPRHRAHNYNNINRKRQNRPMNGNRAFKPWRESNRVKWQRQRGINVNNIQASGICCRHGVNRKKMILHNKLENNLDYNETCDRAPSRILATVEETLDVTEDFCQQKFSSCCKDWSLLSTDFRIPYYPMRRQILM